MDIYYQLLIWIEFFIIVFLYTTLMKRTDTLIEFQDAATKMYMTCDRAVDQLAKLLTKIEPDSSLVFCIANLKPNHSIFKDELGYVARDAEWQGDGVEVLTIEEIEYLTGKPYGYWTDRDVKLAASTV